MISRLRNNRGVALLITLALMAMLTLVAVIAVDRSITDVDLSFNQLHEEQAFYVAEAGLKRAYAELVNDLTWNAGFSNVSFGNGIYSVAVVDSSTNPALLDTIVLRSNSNVSDARATIEAWVVPIIEHPFRYAAFGDDSVIMKNTACTDSYNSDSGSYASTLLNDEGDIGSNGAIDLSNTVDVYGDAVSATEGGITTDGLSMIYGDTTTTAPQQDMAIVSDSEFVWAESNNSAPAGFSGNFSYDPLTHALSLNNVYDTLVLSSGVYYFSTITLGNDASLQVAPGANVTIYMTDNLVLGQGGTVNTSGSAYNMIIYSKGSELILGQHTEFHGAFWGPNTAIIVEQNTNIYGSFVGKRIKIANSACIHYDRSLSKYQKDSIGKPGIVAWREL
ncbi:MAG: hypothetical protein E3J26_01745 [Candidatus Zixiibacteriota bacterium]|nr:MAG: hypothetical protein E3J26_01745 [candidate division Zixibacteria bacterium]